MNLLDYGRRLIVAKGGGEVIASDLADRLREPAQGEEQLLEAFEKQGADAADLDAVAGAARLLKSVGTNLEIDLEIDPAAKAQPIEKSLHVRTPEERARIADEARRFNADVQRRIRKAQEEKTKPRRSAAESLQEVERIVSDIHKSEGERADAGALERLEKAAVEIRKQHPNLTKEVAFTKAMELHPDDYAAYQRHYYAQQVAEQMARQAGGGPEPTEAVAKSDYVRKAEEARAALDRAAEPFLKADPTLTREQAVVMALQRDPSLYERTRP